MKRRDLRGLCCAFLCLGILIAACPVSAQQAAAPPAAKPAAPAAKPVAKKAVRWAPRSRWRRSPRWSKYSRWAKRPYIKKPAAPWRPAVRYAAKPVAPAAAHPAAKPALYTAAARKPVAKPAAKPAWHPASTAKPAAWAMPAPKPATAAKSIVKAAAAPVKATAKPVVKPVAKPAAKKPEPAPENMTRDANNGGATATPAAPIAGGGQLDILGQSLRTGGALVVVLLLIVGVVYFLRRYKLVQTSNGADAAMQAQAMNGAGKGFGAITPVFSNLAGKRSGNGASNGQPLGQNVIGDGGLQIMGAQPLPGSGTTIYLVQIQDHMVLLGASYAGGVRLLAEWEKDEQPETAKEKEAFDSFLRQQGVPSAAPREDEEHTFASIRARLNSTADRLAGLRADFGS